MSEPYPITQEVKIEAGRKYKNIVVARCHDNRITSGRLQINWGDNTGKFIKTDIRNFQCKKEWEKYEFQVTAPLNSATAVVYTSAQTDIFVEFKSNSLLE